jgi:topoisomerase-4 subunit B
LKLVTTHDWAQPVDEGHVQLVRGDASRWRALGVNHLVLEVIAYAVDEAAEGSTRTIDVSVLRDGSVVVVDDGRGTDTRLDVDGSWQVKPIMATADLRFFGVPGAPVLADGRPRAGMSVVAACSQWLEHTNVRSDGAWTARYELGLPVGRPAAVRPVPDGTGTRVHFMPDPQIFGGGGVDVGALRAMTEIIDSAARIQLDVEAQPFGR